MFRLVLHSRVGSDSCLKHTVLLLPTWFVCDRCSCLSHTSSCLSRSTGPRLPTVPSGCGVGDVCMGGSSRWPLLWCRGMKSAAEAVNFSFLSSS